MPGVDIIVDPFEALRAAAAGIANIRLENSNPFAIQDFEVSIVQGKDVLYLDHVTIPAGDPVNSIRGFIEIAAEITPTRSGKKQAFAILAGGFKVATVKANVAKSGGGGGGCALFIADGQVFVPGVNLDLNMNGVPDTELPIAGVTYPVFVTVRDNPSVNIELRIDGVSFGTLSTDPPGPQNRAIQFGSHTFTTAGPHCLETYVNGALNFRDTITVTGAQ